MLSSPRTQFGIHQMTAVNRTTGLPYGTVKVLASANAELSREAFDLYGGSNPNIVDTENGNVSGDLNVEVKEFHPMLYELAGYTKTELSASANGEVSSAVANKVGTSLVAATGLASADIKGTAAASIVYTDVKDGLYIVKAVSATTVDVFAIFDNEFDTGGDLSFVNDTMKITATALTIATDTAVEIPNTGIELLGGSGTIALTEDDTAVFEVRSAHAGGNEYVYGESPEPIEFEMYLTSQTKSNGEYSREHFPRVKFMGIPAGMTEKEWKTAQLTAKILFDTTLGYSRKMVDLTK